MPKKTEYTPDDELTSTVDLMLGTLPQLQDLRDNSVGILCCMKVRMDDDGETEPPKGSPVKLKKLSELERLFIQNKAHYILTMDYHFWKHADRRQQWSKLFDELRDIKPEMTEAGLKLKKRLPSVTVKHVTTLELFGAHDDVTLSIRNAMKNASGRIVEFVDGLDRPAEVADSAASAEMSEAADKVDQESEPEPEPEPEPANEVDQEPEPEPQVKSRSARK